ncbi:hypothetical protein IMZ48_48030 [Candidatus Bathyarchaeota archaeon]|nr:hypothetical protein [Candidatus Bathyarchaeota archaeon]
MAAQAHALVLGQPLPLPPPNGLIFVTLVRTTYMPALSTPNTTPRTSPNSPQEALNLPAAGPALLPPPPSPPACRLCGSPSEQRHALASNPNGNEDRPYYKCTRDGCDRWLVFNDERGNLPDNPECHCGASSKMQAAGPRKDRSLHFVCRLGMCDYFFHLVNEQGRWVCVDELAFYELRRLGYV